MRRSMNGAVVSPIIASVALACAITPPAKAMDGNEVVRGL